MVIKGRCVWNKTFLLVPLYVIRPFHASFHLFSQCFYIRVILTKSSNELFCLLTVSWWLCGHSHLGLSHKRLQIQIILSVVDFVIGLMNSNILFQIQDFYQLQIGGGVQLLLGKSSQKLQEN